MSKNRKVHLIDKFLQLSIAYRVVVYCMAAFLFVLLTLTFWTTFVTGKPFAENLLSNCSRHAPVLVGMFLFLPFAILDSIKFSHRIAGPIHRLRHDLDNYRVDRSVRVQFRQDDYLQDLPETINEILEQLQILENDVKKNDESLRETLA